MKPGFNSFKGHRTDGRIEWCVSCRFDKHCTLKDPGAVHSRGVIPLITNPDGSCQFYKISPWSFRKTPQCRMH